MKVNTAVEVGVLKLGNCLEMYTCAQASVQFVHSMCTNLDTPCTLKLLLGHPLYTGDVYMLGHWLGHMCTFPSSFQAVSKIGHSNFYSSGRCFLAATN